jgi:hypothetical protein
MSRTYSDSQLLKLGATYIHQMRDQFIELRNRLVGSLATKHEAMQLLSYVNENANSVAHPTELLAIQQDLADGRITLKGCREKMKQVYKTPNNSFGCQMLHANDQQKRSNNQKIDCKKLMSVGKKLRSELNLYKNLLVTLREVTEPKPDHEPYAAVNQLFPFGRQIEGNKSWINCYIVNNIEIINRLNVNFFYVNEFFHDPPIIIYTQLITRKGIADKFCDIDKDITTADYRNCLE